MHVAVSCEDHVVRGNGLAALLQGPAGWIFDNWTESEPERFRKTGGRLFKPGEIQMEDALGFGEQDFKKRPAGERSATTFGSGLVLEFQLDQEAILQM